MCLQKIFYLINYFFIIIKLLCLFIIIIDFNIIQSSYDSSKFDGVQVAKTLVHNLGTYSRLDLNIFLIYKKLYTDGNYIF